MNRLPPRRRSQSRLAVAAGFAFGSLAVHALLVATVDFDLGGGDRGVELAALDDLEIDLTSSCAPDAVLAFAARSGLCATPFSKERGACVRRAADDFRLDLIVCDSTQQDIEAEAITFLDLDETPIVPQPLAEVVPPEAIEAARLIEPEPVPEEVEKAREEIRSPRAAGQVVEITAPDVEIRPDDARYVSEYDSKVEKQTVARGSTEAMVEKPQPRALAVGPEPDELPEDVRPPDLEPPSDAPEADADGAGDPGDKLPPSLLAMRGQSSGADESQTAMSRGELDGLEPTEPDGILPERGSGDLDRDAASGAAGSDQAGGAGRRVLPNLRPSEELLSRVAGGGSVDKLDGVESGDFTALNSKKWKFASFFNRMKRQVAQNWHPDRAFLRRDPTGKVYGTKDRVTVLQVSLKPNGSLAKVVIEKQSGVGFLDDEAVNAFELAQPFPNPPGGLVDTESQLITFSFGFHFQIGDGPDNWKIFRYQ